MSIVSCQSCGKQYSVTPDMEGKNVRCSACGTVFAVPANLPTAAVVAATTGPAPVKPATLKHFSANTGTKRADEIDYEIFGDDTQYVEVTLDPGETVIAEAGGMMYMTPGIKMETVFGDPSAQQQGFWSKIAAAGKRVITGESIFMTTFSNVAAQREVVAFAAPMPGKILPMHLDEMGRELICQKGAFMCGAKGVQVGIAFQKKIGVGLFGGEGFIMQRLTGDGIVLIHASGGLMYRELRGGETLKVDTGCLVAMSPSVNYDIQFIGGIKNTLFGGEGLFLATLTGPGKIFLQSLPFSRFAARIFANAPGGRGGHKEEGSILGSLGNMAMGGGK